MYRRFSKLHLASGIESGIRLDAPYDETFSGFGSGTRCAIVSAGSNSCPGSSPPTWSRLRLRQKGREAPRLPPSATSPAFGNPLQGPARGVQATGAGRYPSDGKPEHELPFTPLGRETFMAHKPTFGVTQVPSALTNDPMPGCNPQGFPRIVLHNFRTSRIIQTPGERGDPVRIQ